jgi:hypothetical protein
MRRRALASRAHREAQKKFIKKFYLCLHNSLEFSDFVLRGSTHLSLIIKIFTCPKSFKTPKFSGKKNYLKIWRVIGVTHQNSKTLHDEP